MTLLHVLDQILLEGRRDNDNHLPDEGLLVSLKQFLNPHGRDHESLDQKMTVVTENVGILTPYHEIHHRYRQKNYRSDW